MFLLLSIVLYSCHPLLTLCFQISPFTYEVVIPNGRISSEVVIHSSLEPNRLMCGSKCAALGFELCKGFNWYESESEEEEDTALCELLAFVMENSVILNSPQSAQRSQVYKSSATKCFGDEDCTGLPYAPSCVQNVCTLVCEPHQLETADGNCTLSIETRVDYYGHRSLLPWFNVTVAYVDGVTLDPRCAPSDGCGFILSMEKPSRRYNNFWPEQYNYWPRHQLFIHHSTTDTIGVQYLRVTGPGEREVLEEYSSTQSGLANFTIAFHVAPFQASSGGGSRRVSVKLMDASNIYKDIGSPIEVQAGAALEEGDAFYYFAAVHSASGKSRNITGPNHIRNSIKFNKDPSFAACQAQELSLGVYPSYPYIYTCVQLRTLTGSPTTGKINWFQYFSSSSSSVVVKIKYVVPSSPATNGSYQLYLTSNTLVSNQITSYTPSKFLLLSIDVASSNSSSSPTDQYTFSLMDKNSCKYSSPPGCLSAIQELAVQSVNRSDIDIFDGSFHSFKFSYTYLGVQNDTISCPYDSRNLDQYSYLYRAYIDGQLQISHVHLGDTRCYKAWPSTKPDRISIDDGHYRSLSVLGIKGEGLEYILEDFATEKLST